MNFLFVGSTAVYGIFVLDMSSRSAFAATLSTLSFPCTTMWYPDKNDAIIFRKSVHFV